MGVVGDRRSGSHSNAAKDYSVSSGQSLTIEEKQKLFPLLLTKLTEYAYGLGYEFTLGEAWRPPEMVKIYEAQGKGVSTSVHPLRIAIDINLFKDGVWLKKSEDHVVLGTYWKSLHPLCRWGGDFHKPDGNHYSLEHEKRK